MEEKEFSHIVSGKISSGDKILAFYQGRLVTAREKAIKENFLKLDTKQFLEKINAIKEEKAGLAYAALYINLNKVKEPAAPVPTSSSADLGSSHPEPVPAAQRNDNIGSGTPELPRIIRSEFSLGKKDNPVAVVLGKIKMFIPKRQNKIVFFVSLGILVIVGAWTAKAFLFVSPSQKQTAKAISEAQNNIKLADTKIKQDDKLGARQLLLGSIASIDLVESSKKTDDARV